MARKLHLLLVLLTIGTISFAQQHPVCDIPRAEETCDLACINCNFGGAGGSTGGFAADGAPGFCSGIQNDQWYGFIAGASVNVTFTLSPSNCTNNDGVQIALYADCSGGPLACDGGGTGQGNTPSSITAALTEGQTYFLIIDGFGGDDCNFTLSASPSSAVRPPNVRASGPIIGPSKLCPGATVTYTITPAQGAQFYTWTIPADATINGQPGPGPITFEGAEGTNVEITFGNSGGSLSVLPSNACRLGSPRVKAVTVAPIPPVILPSINVCLNEFPYQLPWGDDANNPGTFNTVIVTPGGCDSSVTVTLVPRPSFNGPVVPKFVCASDPCINVCGDQFCAPTEVSANCKTFKWGCDSIVNLSLIILNPTAIISNGATATLSCSNNRIVLRSAVSATGSVKTWRNLSGGLLGVGDTLVVTASGRYVLNTTMSSSTVSCVKLDTINILSDLIPPTNTPTVNGLVGCGGIPVTLSTTTNAANPSYSWTGPSGFTTTTQQSPTSLIAGTYTVVVRNPANGCTRSANITVNGSTTPPVVTTTGNTLTCANQATGVPISAVTDSVVTYSWAGPSPFSATIANPIVTNSGTYTITVTNISNKCTATATATVNLNNTPPTPTATAVGTISCTTPSINVNATPASGVTYAWTGPPGFTSTIQSPSVTTAGNYTVVVRNIANGCTATATASAAGNTTPPNASAGSGLISCAINSATLTGASTTPGASFLWAGPAGVSSNTATINATTAGTYTLTVRGPNACTAVVTASVAGDFAPPGASAVGGVVSCSNTSVSLMGSSPSPNVTYSWTGPGTPGTQQNPVVSLSGTYILTVRGQNGCTSTATANVTADAGTPVVTATGGTISCTNSSIMLTASATPAGVQLEWAGPGGFFSAASNPTVSVAGTYTVKATNPNNGCEIVSNVIVGQDKNPPVATATGGTVSCNNITITINGNSPAATSIASWGWTGPNGFVSNQRNPNNVTEPGPYQLTVIGTNGCAATATATVIPDKAAPVVSAAGAILTCNNPSLPISSTSSVPATYSWAGPLGATSTQQNPVVNVEGTYRVTITSIGNGCTSTASAPVTLDKTPPGVTAKGDTLTCSKLQVTLGATPGTGTPGYIWQGPGGFGAPQQNPTATAVGTYTVTATASNGCTSTATTQVFENKNEPVLSNQNPEVLTCAKKTITIDATVTGPLSPVTGLAWSGPGFVSALEDPQVTAPGTYVLTATSANGCTNQKTVEVIQDIQAPAAVANGGTLDCVATSLMITASSATTGATFAWTGPGGFAVAAQSTSVSNAGDYILTVTGPNGCTTTATAKVLANINAPNISSTKSDDLDCNKTAISLSANSTTPGATYEWSSPSGAAGTQPILSVTTPGRYIIKILAPNGCFSRDTQVVTQDIVKPDVMTTGALITCAVPSPEITVVSNTAGVTYDWDGPNIFDSALPNPPVTQNGTYTVTVKGPNGCTNVATAIVTKDINIPDIQTQTPAVLTCKDPAAAIDINVVLPSSITQTGLNWTGPTGFTATSEDLSVTVPGTYTVNVSSSNGCQVSTTVTVIQDIKAPGATATAGTLTCANPSVALEGSTPLEVIDVTWLWSGPNAASFTTQNPTVTEAGTYTLVVTSIINGCTSVVNTEMLLNKNAPIVTAASPDTLTCKKTMLVINSTTSLPGTFAWSGAGGFFSAIQNPPNVVAPGMYTVVVKATVNGCTETKTVEVAQNIVAPDAVTKGDTISCNRPTVPISVTTAAPGPRFVWSGPSAFSNSTATPTVPLPGNYVVTVTGFNGCTTTASAVVRIDSARAIINGVPTKILTCTDKTVGINATILSGSPVVTTTWSGPVGYSSSLEDPADITAPGLYKLVVRPANGCTSERTIDVKQDIAVPTNITTQGDTLTCLKLAVNLASNSATTGVTYAWSGPNNYTASVQNPLDISVPGTYTVTVMGTNGCTSTKTAIVAQNVNPPGATATATIAQLDCNDLESILKGTSPAAGVTYQWNGPGVNDPKQDSKTTQPGTYVLIVKSPNSCISRDTVVVTQDISKPDASATGGIIDCISSQTALAGASSTPAVTYAWTGPNNTSFSTQNPTVTQPGTYILTVTGANACTTTASATVNPNVTSPVVNLSGAGTLTCSTKSLLLNAAVSAPASPINTTVWKNAAGVTVSTVDSLRVTAPGIYTFTATSQNGCKSEPKLTVLQDIQPPQVLTATGGKLDCNFPTITINAGSSTAGVSYAWSGPGSYNSTLQNPSDVKTAGTYTVIVTNPINGCSATITALVTEDPTKPKDLSVKTDTLTCARPTVRLDATTNTAGATFLWRGPVSFTSALQAPTTTQAGTYTVVAKGPNGCTSEFSINVAQDKVIPNLSVQGDTITCAAQSGVITAGSTTSGVKYVWTGPGTFTSVAAAPVVTQTGTYTVVVTARNGCTFSNSVQVSPDQNAPKITATGGTVTCAIPTITLSANANANVRWGWTGPGGFISAQPNPSASAPGNYTVIATSIANGCSITTSVEVKADKDSPVVSLTAPEILTCTTTQTDISASTGTPGVFTFLWSTQNGNIVSGKQSPTVKVSTAANYAVTVTNSQNGCTTARTATVNADPAIPSGLGMTNKNVSCFGAKNGAIIIDSVKGGTDPILFSFNGRALSNTQVFTGLGPGIYTLAVEDANGCTFETSIDIKEPQELVVNLGKDTTIFLGNTISLSLDDVVNYPDRIQTTNVFPAEIAGALDSTLLPRKSLIYKLTVIDSNGCKASDERLVIVDRTRHIYIPTIFAPTSGLGNELFYIQGGVDVDMVKSFLVFDRWGNAVHEYRNFLSGDPASGWNGRLGGKNVNPGVFVYFAEILFKDGETVMYKGDVTITR